jgi:acetyltransferase-like isoleucine patch superfamily enzyme
MIIRGRLERSQGVTNLVADKLERLPLAAKTTSPRLPLNGSLPAGAALRTLKRVDDLAGQVKLWVQKWRWYERNSLPWNRGRIHWELLRRGAFARWPLQGNVLEALQDGRLEVGANTMFEPNVWITVGDQARVRIGEGTFLNIAVMVAALELVEIGSHCMLANGCFVTDANHRFDDPDRPVPWQGFDSKGPTRIGDNVWLGANVVVTSGVTIGERCVIGANSVVTQDIPPYSVAAGAPAKVLRTITYDTDTR